MCVFSQLSTVISKTKTNFYFFSSPIGYDRNIPGFPRYSIFGDEKEGVHNLRIENASLEDYGEYQCQVSICKLELKKVFFS